MPIGTTVIIPVVQDTGVGVFQCHRVNAWSCTVIPLYAFVVVWCVMGNQEKTARFHVFTAMIVFLAYLATSILTRDLLTEGYGVVLRSVGT